MGPLHTDPLMRAISILTIAAALSAVAPAFCQTDADPRAIVLSACEDAADFSAARTADDPRFDFSAWEATVFDGARVSGRSLRWHLRPSSAAQHTARLAWTGSLAEAVSEVSVWVKNPNAHQLQLRFEALDAYGAAYLSQPVDLAEETAWRELKFSIGDLTTEDADPFVGLDFPLVRLALVVSSLGPDRPHTIYFDELTATLPEARSLAVAAIVCPASATPADTLAVRVSFAPPLSADGDSEATIREDMPGDSNGTAGTTATADGDDNDGTATARRGTSPRPTTATTTAGGALGPPVVAQLVSAEGAVVNQARMSPEGTASLGVPSWLTPGQYSVRITSSGMQITGASSREIAIGGSGPRQTAVAIDPGLSPPALLIGADRFAPIVEEMQGGLPADLDGRARVVGVPATTDRHPFAWTPDAEAADGTPDLSGLDRRIAGLLNRHPDALIVLQVWMDSTAAWDAQHPEDLQQFGGSSLAPPAVFSLKRTCPDIVSPRWQDDARERLRGLIEHVEAAPWGQKIIGYELQAGDLGAWRPWGASLGIGDEATTVRKDAFREWLYDHYDSVEALRDHWLGRRRGFGSPTAGFESVEFPEPLKDRPEPSLYDPAADQPMIDLQHFRAEAIAGIISTMAQVVREQARPGTLVGACYGHLLSQARANDWTWPHLALTQLLESGEMDFLTGPQYRYDTPWLASSLASSARRAGVLYLERIEDDVPAPEDCGIIASPAALTGLQRLPAPVAPADDAPVIEVFDDFSARFLSGSGALPRDLLGRPMAGDLPHRSYLLRDLLNTGAPRASIYLFRDLFVAEPEQGRALAQNTARDGSLLVWVYAPGAISGHYITGRTMEYLTGIKLSPLTKRGKLIVTPVGGSFPAYGFSGVLDPWFISVDERAEWLGTVPGGDEGFCGLALRKFPHCTSVFSAAPPSEQLLQYLARRSGIDLTAQAH